MALLVFNGFNGTDNTVIMTGRDDNCWFYVDGGFLLKLFTCLILTKYTIVFVSNLYIEFIKQLLALYIKFS